MRPTSPFIALLLLTGCSGDGGGQDSAEPPGVCSPRKGEDPELDISHYGQFSEDVPIVYCGTPPQGGAPYAPFGVRVRGVEPREGNAMTVTVTATDTTTQEEVGAGVFNNLFLCSNVGDNEGWWLLNEIHLRFFYQTLEGLHEREIDLQVTAEGATDSVSQTWTVDLDCVAGD